MKGKGLSRRDLLHLAGAGTIGSGTLIVPKDATAKTIDPTAEYDVIVCGGGTSGLPAAVSAARQGAKVAIIERYGFLAGNVAFSIMPCWHGITSTCI